MSDDPKFTKAATSLASMLAMLSSPARWHMIEIMFNGEIGVTELSNAVRLSQSATSQHLAKLRNSGVVAFRSSRQSKYYRIADGMEAMLWQLMAIADTHAQLSQN